MVKHTQTICWKIDDELFECLTICWVGTSRVKLYSSIEILVFNQSFGCSNANIGRLAREQPYSPNFNDSVWTTQLTFHLEDHQESRDDIVSCFEPSTFWTIVPSCNQLRPFFLDFNFITTRVSAKATFCFIINLKLLKHNYMERFVRFCSICTIYQ